MNYEFALKYAEMVRDILAPHCDRIEIAGSIRRKKKEDIKDIEIVCIPKPYDVGLFESGIATEVNQWLKVKGDLPCKYTQRVLWDGTILDLFFATPSNWGLIYAIRTGSAEYSHKVLATGWVKKGYKSVDGMLINDRGNPVLIPDEEHLFRLIGVDYVEPENRNL